MRRSSRAVRGRTVRFLLGAWAAAMSVGCLINITDSDRDLDAEAFEEFFVQLDAATDVRLRLEGINGVVTVLGDAASSTARVTAELRVRSDSRSDAEQFLGRVTVEVLERGDEIIVRTEQPSDTGGRAVNVDYDLIVPAQFDVHIVNVNGGIEVRSVEGTVEVANVNGTVAVLDVVGDVQVALVNGDITGDITLLPNGLVDLHTVNGTVSVDVPTSVSAMIEADVANGSISVAGLTILDATVSTRSVRGRLGGGDGLIDLETTNGTIIVRGR